MPGMTHDPDVAATLKVIEDCGHVEHYVACDLCIATALAAQRAAGAAVERERIKAYLNEWAAAYHEDIFRPLAEGEAAEVNATYPAFSDRVAAQQGRHMARSLLKQISAQPVAPPEGPR